MVKCGWVAALVLPEGDFGAPPVAEDGAGVPGRPERPALIRPRDVPHRGLGSVAGRVALLHAVAHIEFNAINLALDACWRFRGMPADYYRDWLSVAQDEARHFSLLSARLAQLGAAYGELPAHNGLWEAAEKTATDPLLRMALVPRVLEARGLDVTPGMIGRLTEVGDAETVAILRVILDEEVRHVAIGTRWFEFLCGQRGLEPQPTFARLLAEHRVRVAPPLNREARVRAGFAEDEMDALLAAPR
ncbi:ferritin-like domain-containing protein [Solimonas sp. SE-A11]|uniref:ferritin-like domain-containing protein n=1 Tax=Solimonas sp. SE-A11 TaxID=3054954 RepID=UPI002646E889|nr:ferritin-like domain-containing protein [Solimonas sp. SE-A11]